MKKRDKKRPVFAITGLVVLITTIFLSNKFLDERNIFLILLFISFIFGVISVKKNEKMLWFGIIDMGASIFFGSWIIVRGVICC